MFKIKNLFLVTLFFSTAIEAKDVTKWDLFKQKMGCRAVLLKEKSKNCFNSVKKDIKAALKNPKSKSKEALDWAKKNPEKSALIAGLATYGIGFSYLKYVENQDLDVSLLHATTVGVSLVWGAPIIGPMILIDQYLLDPIKEWKSK